MYIIACIVYGLAAVGLCGYVWWLTRNIKLTPVKNCLRVWLAIILVVPGYIVEGQPELAPAFMIVAFKTLTEGWSVASPFAAPLVAAASIATAVIIIVPFVDWVRKPKNNAEAEQ